LSDLLPPIALKGNDDMDITAPGAIVTRERTATKPPRLVHALRAMRGVVSRELFKFSRQFGRLISALVRPALWLVVFAAGMQNLFGVAPIEPYSTYIPYQEYIVPGLLGIVMLFNGMQSSLSLVYDREMGTMRLLLTAPLPRWYLLFCKLIAGTVLSVIQSYAFLIIAYLVGVQIPWSGWVYILPALLLAGFLMGSIGLLLSADIPMIENFAATMNFVIFPMFFVSSALYPLWKLRESGAEYIFWAAQVNPFTHAVELVRYAAYGKFNLMALLIVIGTGAVCFILAALAYDPQRGLVRLRA
jgi:ABC-2 type transport system permease protein